MKVSGSRVEEALLWIFLNRSGEGFDWLHSLTEGEVDVSIYVGYKGPAFEEYPATHHIFKKKDSIKYENFGGGMLACEIMEKEYVKNGGKLYRDTSAEQLEKNSEGRVISCIAMCPDGKYRRYAGTEAVVLATGDASDDREMLEAFCPTGLRASRQTIRRGNTGDGQKMAYWAGAALDNPEWAPTLHALGYSGLQMFYLHINRIGKRFMNEDTWMQAKSIRCMMQPGGDYAYTVFDSKYPDEVAERWDLLGGQGMAPLSSIGMKFDRDALVNTVEGIVKGLVYRGADRGEDPAENAIRAKSFGFKADSLDKLADMMDVPAATLKETVGRYNKLVADGDDIDFGKRSNMLTTIVEPPFYALKWGPTLLDVFGGALTDTRLNVIGADSHPITGLYAVGNAAGGMYAVDYPLLLNGNSYGRALAHAMQIADSLS
jgi:succinate dehydrogenase/fumarate reductase flavoprotein subunit